MNKTLTKIETLTTVTKVTYHKLHFGNQYFMLTPWHYEPANMMHMLDKVESLEEGKEYDIKWRKGKVKGQSVTILTQCEEVVVEFEWEGEEEGGESHTEGFNEQLDTFVSKVNNMAQKAPETPPCPFDFDFDEDSIPF